MRAILMDKSIHGILVFGQQPLAALYKTLDRDYGTSLKVSHPWREVEYGNVMLVEACLIVLYLDLQFRCNILC